MIEVWTDGACGPENPGGTMGWGFLINSNKVLIKSDCGGVKASPNNSNNLAEYLAFIFALEWLHSHDLEGHEIFFRCDSKLIVRQMTGRWRIIGGAYAETAKKAKSLFKFFRKSQIIWVPREANVEADRLSKAGMLCL